MIGLIRLAARNLTRNWLRTILTVLGAAVGVTLILLKRQEMSSRLPYGPYIAAAAVIWIFAGHRLMDYWFNRML